METEYLFKAMIALIVVFGLLSILAWGLRKYGGNTFISSSGRTVQVMDTLYLDNARRVVCIKRGNKRYLLLLGHKELLVDSWEEPHYSPEME